MRFLFKRRLRLVGAIGAVVLLISLTAKCVVQFQLNREIEHYRTFFRKHKDNIHDIYDPLNIKQIPYETIESLYQLRKTGDVPKKSPIDWGKYAYINYVTDADYLCTSLLQFKRLKEFGTKAKLVLLISSNLLEAENPKISENKQLLEKFQEVAPTQVLIKEVENIIKPHDYSPWNKSFTKLLVFNQTEFDRIVYLDNDAGVYNHMDELFFLPDYVKFAAPLTYWFVSERDLEIANSEVSSEEKSSIKLNRYIDTLATRVKEKRPIYNHLPSLPSSLFMGTKDVAKEIIESTSSASPLFNLRNKNKNAKVKFASNLMVIKPSAETFNAIVNTLLPRIANKKEKYDMDLINEGLYDLRKIIYHQFKLFRKLKTEFVPEVLSLPFGSYGLLTGSIRNEFHHTLMANDILGYERTKEKDQVPLESLIKKSKYIHYSDYPMSKPWAYSSFDHLKCNPQDADAESEDVKAEMCKCWNSVYQDYWDSKHFCTL
ncbi:glucose N-acetyltransferase [Lachancea thermotolerans CBS 6340]|uniref:KLTH0E14014p n=1 Tax=Lachancea thermotolerans (strain ATCC 56472 / CBS 6340 / NRRL Y-8284) TaxID=559295 RepID=C5DIP0_LACTC|nr:KLTH0E14014p [Lachancea thermotolerans CBS 6340]CAR23651.1 KLTH0E14014p [Lachancea thermotolerans CBS 6340]